MFANYLFSHSLHLAFSCTSSLWFLFDPMHPMVQQRQMLLALPPLLGHHNLLCYPSDWVNLIIQVFLASDTIPLVDPFLPLTPCAPCTLGLPAGAADIYIYIYPQHLGLQLDLQCIKSKMTPIFCSSSDATRSQGTLRSSFSLWSLALGQPIVPAGSVWPLTPGFLVDLANCLGPLIHGAPCSPLKSSASLNPVFPHGPLFFN